MSVPIDVTFSSGVTISSPWLNGVNDHVNDQEVDPHPTLSYRAARAVNHQPFSYDYASGSSVIFDGSSDTYHRHFGGIAEGINGRLHLVYGKNTEHAATAGATSYYSYSDDGGYTWSTETVLIPVNVVADQRSLSICVTLTGRVLVAYAEVIQPSTTTTPTTIKTIYSDDNGVTWQQGNDIVTINYTYCRAYGRIKKVPGTNRLITTPYYRSDDVPNYKVAVWESTDNGDSWTEKTAIVNSTDGYNETEIVAITPQVWFAASRGATGLQLSKTVNGGTSWSVVGIVPGTSTDNQVAPTLDKFYHKGQWYLVLGYCDRSTDDLRWKIAEVSAALVSTNAFGTALITATDMVNASGYQSPITDAYGNLYVDGGTGFVEFKEYIGQTYTQVRFSRMDLFALSLANPRVISIASGIIDIPNDAFETTVQVDTEALAATDDLDTITGGTTGAIIIFQGPQTTSARDVIFKNGTGNIDLLRGDFRINTITSRLVLQKVATRWVELYRTDDNTNTAITIAADAITVPASRFIESYLIDTEAAAATDDLSTINGGREGQVIILFSSTSSRDPTLKDGIGNLSLAGDFTLTNIADNITLVKRGTTWYEQGRSDNA